LRSSPRRILRIHVTPHFERAYRALSPGLQRLASEKDALFRADAFDPRLKTHILKGRLKGLWSYSVDYCHRVLFEFLTHEHVLYHDIGSHEIYR
jgi:mRNA-degrading endonuclease YafQ of YafQ-DinJ toxin-antitoxin module